MDDSDWPPLDAEITESIAVEQHPIHKRYRLELYAQLPGIFANAGMSLASVALMGGLTPGPKMPPEPPRPVRLYRTLGSYACALFDVEAGKYPDEPGLQRWLLKLATRIETMVIAHVRQVGPGPLDSGTVGKLTDHASYDEMRIAVRKSLQDYIEQRSKPKPKVPIITHEPSLVDLLDRGTGYGTSTQPQRAIANAEPSADSSRAAKRKRLSSTITSAVAGRRLEAFLDTSPIKKTDFASSVGVTERTLRHFRNTGQIKRETLHKIAEEMGLTVDQLLRPD